MVIKKAKVTYGQIKPRRFPMYRPVVVNSGKQSFPKQLRNTVTYAETVNIGLTTGAYGQYIFSCNGLYDPNITGTGHQPLYFDQLSGIYNHYTVLNSRISVTPVYTAGNNLYTVVVFKDDDTTTNVSNTATAIERPGATFASFGTQDNTRTLYQRWNAHDTFGGDPLADNVLIGTSASNPAEQTYYVIGVEDHGLNTDSIYFTVRIEYDTVWDELKSMGSS